MVMLRALLPELQDSWASLHPDDPGHTSNAEDQGKGGLIPCLCIEEQATQVVWLSAMLHAVQTSHSQDHRACAGDFRQACATR